MWLDTDRISGKRGLSMTDKTDRSADKTPSTTLSNDEIKTTRQRDRRSFLKTLGIGLAGAAALATGRTTPARASDDDGNDNTTHHDFPKGGADGDQTTNADLKYSDSDDRDSKSADSDQNRLRDAQGSSDSD